MCLTYKLKLPAETLVLIANCTNAETLHWASISDPQTMGPHVVNAAPVHPFATTSKKALYALAKIF